MILKLKRSAVVFVLTILVLAPDGAQRVLAAEDSTSHPGEGTSATATFAGGCFWCMESDFEKAPGVTDVISGYAGGTGDQPTYKDYGRKGYIEAVQVTYDPHRMSYPELLKYFWHHIDPLDAGGQFCDRGHEYTTAIFYHTERQKGLAEESKSALETSGRLKGPVATKIIAAGAFYPAEDYHQDYYKKNPIKYRFYRLKCGRDLRLREVWE